MTYRLDTRRQGGRVILYFQGVLDRTAMSEIRAQAGAPVLLGVPLRLVLLARTEVESDCMHELARLPGVEVVAQDPFLRRWLEGCG
jgi:hypothetical protein